METKPFDVHDARSTPACVRTVPPAASRSPGTSTALPLERRWSRQADRLNSEVNTQVAIVGMTEERR